MEMTNSLALIIICALFCGSATGARLKLFSSDHNATATLHPTAADGICKLMVETRGYACEEHKVTTKDGYILSLQRIPVGRFAKPARIRPPVILQHGVLMDGITWLLLPADQCLALLLADDGFDVWIVNSRGTKYSLGHTSLSPSNPAYWDWTWDQLVAYDLPATFGYVQGQTGQKLHYIGHSLGTLMIMAALSKNQLLRSVRSVGLLCPIAHLGLLTSPLAKAAADNFVAETMYQWGLDEFDPLGQPVANLLKQVCTKTNIDCTDLLTCFTGQNCCLNPSIVGSFLTYEPQPTATKNMVHLSQMIRTGKIMMYNYTSEALNMEHYGQPTPPVYDMSKIPNHIPLFISYGGADELADFRDVQLLLRNLRRRHGDRHVVQYRPNYAHADFVMSGNAKRDVYDPLMVFLKLQ